MTEEKGPTFLESLIAAAIAAATPGAGVPWSAVAKQRIGGAPVSDGEYRSVWNERATVMAALGEAGFNVVPVTERYWDANEAYDEGLTYKSSDLRRYLPFPGVGPGVGFHVAEDSTDQLWTEWRKFQMRKFGGGQASQAEQSLKAAGIDGNVAGAMDVLKEGYQTATPGALNAQIKATLGTTGPKLLTETLK